MTMRPTFLFLPTLVLALAAGTSAAAADPSRAGLPPASAKPAEPPRAAIADHVQTPVTNAPAPFLPGMSGNSRITSRAGRYRAIPPAIVDFVLALPTQDLLASAAFRQRALAIDDAYVIEIPNRDGEPDYYLIDRNASDYMFWVRSLRGTTPGLTGYLVQFRVRCKDVLRIPSSVAEPALRAACARRGAEYADSGLHAYRVVAGHAPEDVTPTVAALTTGLGAGDLRRYEGMGANGLYIDETRLDRVPVFRWTIEFDPEQPLPASNPRAFDHGGYVHGGFVVWTGERFERRDTVPASLWPCPKASPSLCPDDDRFVTRDH